MQAHKPKPYAKTFSFVLEAGPWRRQVPIAQCRLIQAEALNNCVCHEKFSMKIKGYLLTGRRTFLVIDIKEDQLDDMLAFFYRSVRRSLMEHENTRSVPGSHQEHLFSKHPLYDPVLVQMLTGQHAKQPYASADLERMKLYLLREKFCSVIDYQGGQSPVLVDVPRFDTNTAKK